MKILISNDDGFTAPGILALAEAMREIGDATIVAPDRNKSGASNSLTLATPFHVRKVDDRTYCVEGTPTDCVHVALTGMLDEAPDIVVSGINAGVNLGDDVLYSGTVAAAMEGRCVGKPAIAISLLEPCEHYETAARVAKILVERLMADPLPADTILNVNLPDLPFDQLQGFEVTRLGTRHRAENAIPDTDPRGKPIYWIGPAGAEMDNGPGTDFHAVRNNKVSVTPIQIDLTNYKAFEQLSQWMEGI